MDHARAEFKLAQTDESGTTLREHLEQVKKQTKRTPADLIVPPLDQRIKFIWSIFLDLHNTRDGSTPITYREMEAYSGITGNIVGNWESNVVKSLDRLWFEVSRNG